MAFTPGIVLPFLLGQSSANYTVPGIKAFGDGVELPDLVGLSDGIYSGSGAKAFYSGAELPDLLELSPDNYVSEDVKAFSDGEELYISIRPYIQGDDSIEILVGLYLDFSASPVRGESPLTVQFSNESSLEHFQSWRWDFGDGNTSISLNPIHIYDEPGSYDVTLEGRAGPTWYPITRKRYITVIWEGLRVAKTNKSYRLAIKPEQGVGWTEYTGAWVFPEARVGTLKMFDIKNQPIWVVLDADTGKIYLMANRNGPEGSNIEKLFQDKVTSYGGTEIQCALKTKEHTGKLEKPLRHLTSYLYLRPYDEANKNQTGYTATGQREAQRVDVKGYEEGESVAESTVTDIPKNGEVAFDKKIEAERIQIGYEFQASEFKAVGFAQSYLYRDRKGVPSQVITSEQDWQNEYGLPVLWFSRANDLTIDRATAVAATGSIAGGITGPDLKTLSAMSFGLVNGLSGTVSNMASNFTIQFSMANISATTEIFSLATGAGVVEVVVSGGQYSLRYKDSSNDITQPLGWTGTGWTTVKISRDSSILTISEGGNLLQTFTVTAATIGGAYALMNNVAGSIFDFRIVARAVSLDAFGYYYTDLTRNNGNVFLPMW